MPIFLSFLKAKIVETLTGIRFEIVNAGTIFFLCPLRSTRTVPPGTVAAPVAYTLSLPDLFADVRPEAHSTQAAVKVHDVAKFLTSHNPMKRS